VQYVNDNGNVNYNDYDWNKGVRPALGWKTRKSKSTSEMRVPSSNEQISLPVIKKQDKYKGMKFYDRR
jgi:hypothetical protein